MGGLSTSANDLARYVAFHHSAWPPRDDAERGPVRRASLREMHLLSRLDRLDARPAVVGYGYGVAVTRDCRFRHVVGHGGGLPGFGSYMMWLPEYGIGFLGMANLTYLGSSAAMWESLHVLDKTGALEPRRLPASPLLTSTRDEIARLFREWDDRAAERLAADNLLKDRSAALRRADIDKLRAEVGNCRETGEVRPENWLRGAFTMRCDRGDVEARFTLAPTEPPRVQYLHFSRAAEAAQPGCNPR
jgi:CubicO group peptidase (beta-lactamase class C family)